MSVNLGILDVTAIERGETAEFVLRNSVELAIRAEQLGFERYWLAEHHANHVAQATPELIVAAIASRTESIRVGTAGILLSLHNPLRVADTCRVLSSLFPGRIDIGLGRGIPPLKQRMEILMGQTVLDPSTFAGKLKQLLGYLSNCSDVAAIPPSSNPDLWLLGSGSASAALAAECGTSYGHALFFGNRDNPEQLLEIYPGRFCPRPEQQGPEWCVAVAGTCAETRSEALRNAAACRNFVITPTVIGTPDECREMLLDLSERYKTKNLIFCDVAPRSGARVRSLEQLAWIMQVASASPIEVNIPI